jgi:hypothetical protein
MAVFLIDAAGHGGWPAALVSMGSDTNREISPHL